MKSPELTLLLDSLRQDLRRLHPDTKGLDRDFRTIGLRVEHEGFSFLAKTLPMLVQALQQGLEEKRFTCPSNFSKVRGGALPKLLSGLLCDVFDVRTGTLLVEPSAEAILTIRQIGFLFKKALGTESDNDHLSNAALESFFETEASILDELPDAMKYSLERVSRVILADLDASLEELHMKHGPGAVVERVKGNQKWSLLTKGLYSGFLDNFGFADLFISSRWDDHLSTPGQVPGEVSLAGGSNCFRGSAKLCAVPKSSTSMRTITIEPMLNQFVQQGLNDALRGSISRCRVLSRCLALSDQTINNQMAKIGSLRGTYATIDLKSASDLLSVKVVKSVFHNHPKFLEMAMDCRSDSVKHESATRVIRKYAGMGNATTFPIQSVCFAVIGIASVLIAEGKTFSYGNIRRASAYFRVYGDDIIVRSEYGRQVVQGLHSVGLKVNTSKSFFDGRFKESCGTDWFAGTEVTPVYLKFHPSTISQEIRAVANYAEAANRSYLRCLYKFAEALQTIVEAVTGRLPLVRKCEWSTVYGGLVESRSSPGLGWITRQGHYEFQRWNPYHHNWTVRTKVITSVRTEDVVDGYPALFKFFLTPLLGRATDHLKRSPVRYLTRLRSRWVPA